MEPQMVIPKDQAYFYTSDWQKDEQKASEDIKKGRVTKTKNVKELFKKLKNEQKSRSNFSKQIPATLPTIFSAILKSPTPPEHPPQNPSRPSQNQSRRA